jgi:hypothetical protein
MKYIFSSLIIFAFAELINWGQDCKNAYPIAGPPVPGRIYTEKNHYAENSPYLFPEWRQGTVQFTNGKILTGLELRYHSAADQLLYYNRADNYTMIVESDYVKEFSLIDPVNLKLIRFRRLGFQTNYFPDSHNCFVQILAEGHVSLYAIRIKQKQNSSGSNQSQAQQFYYSSSNAYYLQLKGKGLVKFKPSNREVRNILSDKKEELKSYIRREGLNTRKESDLVKLIDYYNSL